MAQRKLGGGVLVYSSAVKYQLSRSLYHVEWSNKEEA